MVLQALQPEFFILLGIDLCLITSLLTCLLDKHLPGTLAYLYQIVALAGFGHLIAIREFLPVFGTYMRFWNCFAYLMISLASIVAVNIYLWVHRKKRALAKNFLWAITLPAVIISTFFMVNYVALALHPLLMFPALPLESTFIAVFTFDVGVVVIAVYLFFKPKWAHIVIGASAAVVGVMYYSFIQPIWGTSTLVIAALALGIWCAIVLVMSSYLLLRLSSERLNGKKKKRR